MKKSIISTIIAGIIMLFFTGCVEKIVYKDALEILHCEDAMLVGYTSSYLGHDEWMKLVDSFNKTKYKGRYRDSCGEWNPHYCGHRIFIEGKK